MTPRSRSAALSPLRIGTISAIVAFALLWSVYEVLQPIAPDQGVALWAGDVIRRGGVLYRDAWDTRGPAPYYFTSLIEIVFGHNVWGFRLVDLLIQIAGACGIAVLVKRLGNSRFSAVLAGAFYMLWYASMRFENSAQADGWVGVLLVFSVLALIPPTRLTYKRMFASGFLLGLCVLNKPTYGLFLALPLMYTARPPVTLHRWAAHVAAAAIGAAVPVAIAVIYFWHKGVLATAYDVHVGYSIQVYGHVNDPWLLRLRDAGLGLVHLPMLFALPLVAAGIATLWRRDRYACALVSWWLVATVLNEMVQHKPWLYEWLPVLAPFAVLSGLALSKLPDVAKTGTGHLRKWRDLSLPIALIAGVAVFVGLLGPAHRVGKWVAHLVLRTPEEAYQASEYAEWGYQPASVYGVAQYVKQRTAPDDNVLFFGLLGGGTFYADRPTPTRFGVVRPLFDVGAASVSFGRRYRAEFMSEVQQHVPKYVITYGDSVCGANRSRNDWQCTENFPEFRTWLVNHYRVDAERGTFEIWQYKGTSLPALSPLSGGKSAG